ncbi:MAG: HD domain-containing protein [Saprospiraceae bacterium]
MSTIKIFNDPIYGFIQVPNGILIELIDHPWFQRLRRIKQLGLSHFVYPGAVHTRFHHALGAFHLMTKSLEILKLKGQIISQEEFEAAQIAALLHDIGHGPFSHVLEHSLVPVDHEVLTVLIMKELNLQFQGKLQLAIDIFQGFYSRPFFYQLVASQLDVDRMDYLNRDSFYSGVVEGTIGNDRILSMMDVADEQLIFEEKAALSIENYLAARRLMYWQVYMHKTSLVAEHMLQVLLVSCKTLKIDPVHTTGLSYFMQLPQSFNIDDNATELLKYYQKIDDTDIELLLKQCVDSNNEFVSYLSSCLLSRKFFKNILSNEHFDLDWIKELRTKTKHLFNLDIIDSKLLVSENELSFSAYELGDSEVKIRTKNNTVKRLSEIIAIDYFTRREVKYFLTIPKELDSETVLQAQ